MIEVETKVLVRNPDFIRKRARVLGKFIGKEKKVDDYYTLEALDHYPQKSLRIRKIDGYYIVNFKQRLSYKKGVHAKNEVEFKVSNINDFLRLIEDFGFRKWLTKEKRCEVFEIRKNFHIELNRVKGLGWFVEIERLSDVRGIAKAREEVVGIIRELGFAKKDVVKSGYTKLLWDKRNKK